MVYIRGTGPHLNLRGAGKAEESRQCETVAPAHLGHLPVRCHIVPYRYLCRGNRAMAPVLLTCTGVVKRKAILSRIKLPDMGGGPFWTVMCILHERA
jgi:hypothetical protein